MSNELDEVADPADLTGLSPMQVAKRFVHFKRIARDAQASIDDATRVINVCHDRLFELMEQGEWPNNARVDGATVYLQTQVWASAADKDHARLSRVLRDVGLVEFLPSTVNSQRISGYVREHLHPDESLPLDERLRLGSPENGPMPEALRDALKITEKHTIKPNGL